MQVYRMGTDQRKELLWTMVLRADTVWTRFKGLIGRKGIDCEEGLWLTPCNQVHSHLMHFTIDLIFLDQRGIVLKCLTLEPGRHSPQIRKASSVLEVAAGTVKQKNIAPGDPLLFDLN